MNKEQEVKIQAIYLNSRQYMRDTLEDWEKVFGCFEKVLAESGKDQQVNKQIQKMIIKLENYLRGE